jgi:hypothetical protein
MRIIEIANSDEKAIVFVSVNTGASSCRYPSSSTNPSQEHLADHTACWEF